MSLYKDNKWQIVNRKEQIDDLYECNEIILEEWYQNYKDKDNEMIKSLTIFKMQRTRRMLNNEKKKYY